MPPVIDQEKCLGCEEYLECEECAVLHDCPQDVFDTENIDGLIIVGNPENCILCGICLDSCIGDAITLEK